MVRVLGHDKNFLKIFLKNWLDFLLIDPVLYSQKRFLEDLSFHIS